MSLILPVLHGEQGDINGNSYNTLMSVVNTTSSTKAVKVRFREGKNSVEVA